MCIRDRDGDAPLKSVKAPSRAAMDAASAQQALLAEKTSKQYAKASLLYLKSDGLSQIPRLMDESSVALKEGDVKGFNSLHRQIVARLQSAQSDLRSGDTLIIPNPPSAGVQKQLLGGEDAQAPESYKQQVADYYRSLTGGK